MLPFLAVIYNRNFRNLWLGQITSQIAINMMAFVLMLRIYQTTTSNTAVSFLILTIGLPAIFFGVLAGTLVDRWDKRNVLIVTNLLRMVLLVGFFASSETLPWLYSLVLAISITTQFFVPAEAPTIPRFVPQELLLTANSAFTFTFYTSMIAGFVFSGPALRFFGPHNVFLFLAALLALAAFFVSQIPPEGSPRGEKIKFGKEELISIYRESLRGLEFVKRKNEVGGAIFLLTASQALVASLASLAPGFADRILAIEIEDASYLIMGPAAIGIVIGALLVGQFGRRFTRQNLINLGIILTGILLFSLSLDVRFGGLLAAVVLLFLLGVANSLVTVPANTSLQEDAPSQFRGRVYGVLTSFVGGAAILPVMITGLAADIFGIGKVIFGIASLIFLYGIYRLIKEQYNKQISRII
ncbi:MFS transporter [Candidatus Gottesmanbacteria bacterium]|nr:MFS transporter [Candidatus Gottesmanbacteria bacterium]